MSQFLLAPLSQQPVNRVHLFCRAERAVTAPLLPAISSGSCASKILVNDSFIPSGKESLILALLAAFPLCLDAEVSALVFLSSPELGRTGRGMELLLRINTSRGTMRNGQIRSCSLLALEQRWGGCAARGQAGLEARAFGPSFSS